MAILIVKLKKQVFHDEESGCHWITAKAGNENVLIEFSDALYDIPKILKTVEYKLIGDWRKKRDGGKIFEVTKYDRINKTTLSKTKAYDAHLN